MNYTGNYPIESREGEIQRLEIQGAAMRPDTEAMLDLIGVREGWHCADLGCGPRGITDVLSNSVGRTGRVVGVDMEPAFLDYGRKNAASNTEFVSGDVYATGLPSNTFDLVHMRFVASTAGNPDALIKEAIRIAKPGGTVALQEPDGSTLHCFPPHASWHRLKAALLGAFKGVGADLELASRLYSIVYESPLTDVQYRTFVIAVRSTDPMADYLPSTVHSLKATVLRLNLLTEHEFDSELASCRSHLSRPGTSFTMYTVAQVWGRKR